MNTKYIRLSFFIVPLIIMLSGCNVATYLQQDPFYQDGSEWDHLQFPLIKPYYAIYITDEYGWGIPLMADPPSKALYYYYQLHKVQKIAIENNVIMVYTPYKEQVDQSVGQKVLYWFVFIPDQNIEMGFDKEADFLAYIQQYGIQNPSWREPKAILQEYDQTLCLDWIPACK